MCIDPGTGIIFELIKNFRCNNHFGDTGWPFPVVAAYLRLGIKYDIEHLRIEAVDVLSAGFPSTLEENDVETLGYEQGVQPLVYERSIFFDVITLVRETGMDYILPAAYCRYCGMFALDEVWEGIERVDGTRSVLSTQDQKAILRGWHALSSPAAQVMMPSAPSFAAS